MRTSPFVLALALGGAPACDNSKTPGTDEGGAPSLSASVSAATAVPPAASSASVATTTAWKGTYKSAPGTLYVPAEWKNVHWSGTDASTGVGEGTIDITIDGATRRVSGSLEGPLGPAEVDGVLIDDKLTAVLRRKDPSDQGFTGTLVGTRSGGHLEGTMSVSPAMAGAVRAVTFALSRGTESP